MFYSCLFGLKYENRGFWVMFMELQPYPHIKFYISIASALLILLLFMTIFLISNRQDASEFYKNTTSLRSLIMSIIWPFDLKNSMPNCMSYACMSKNWP